MYGTVPDSATDVTPPRRGGPAKLPLTPGRRVALAVGVPLCLALVLLAGLGLVSDVGRGSFPVRYAVPAGASQVSVSTSGGDLVLRSAAPGHASLTGTAYYSLIRRNVTERLAAGRAAFNYSCAREFGSCGLNATLGVPAETIVSVDSGGGNVSAAGSSGPVTISTEGGELAAQDMTGDLTLSTGGGNITATSVAAPQLTADTAGGEITATAVRSGQVIADTGGGDVEIVFTKVPHYVQVSTNGGTVTIIVPQGTTQYHVTATTNGGNLTSEIPTNPRSSNLITATSGGGNIILQQSS
jgi:hypothetical protein